MVHYKLTYFPIRGAGEIARQIFAAAGQDYEDNRVPKDDWPALKASTPFGQMPVLEVDGKQLAQSHAIARYLAKQFGLNGTTAWEEAEVNSLADQFKDYASESRPYFLVFAGFAPGDAAKLKEEVFRPAIEKNFTFFSKFLKSNTSGFLVGSGLTWVDLLIAQHVQDILSQDATLLAKFPEFVEHQKKIQSIPNIKKWIESRPQTPF